MIQELDAQQTEEVKQQVAEAAAKAEEEQKQFDFETAEREELRGAFIQQPDIVFYNISAKGYNKETDVRYAL